jgi:hypothetical protein
MPCIVFKVRYAVKERLRRTGRFLEEIRRDRQHGIERLKSAVVYK